MSQHVDDLSSEEMVERYLFLLGDLQRLHGIQPQAVIRDMHPQYCRPDSWPMEGGGGLFPASF